MYAIQLLRLQFLTHWSIVRHGVHAKGHFLFRVLVKLLPHGKCLCNHLTLFDPLGLIVASTNNSDGGTQKRLENKVKNKSNIQLTKTHYIC